MFRMKNNRLDRWLFLLFAVASSVILISLFTSCSDVSVNGVSYPQTTTELTLTDKMEDYSVLTKLENLHTLDLSSLELTADEYDLIASKVGENVRIIWNVPVGDKKVPCSTEELELTPEWNLTDASFMPYLKNLKTLTLSSIEVSPLLQEIYHAAHEINPDMNISCKTSVYGVELDNTTDFLDLNDIKITDLTDLDIAMELFPELKTVEICSCELDNETIAALRDKYPDKKLVWLIKFHYYAVRTDAQVFSTLANDGKFSVTSEMISPLFRYCTDLRALDVGHESLTDISEITNLKKLHTLILAFNKITDISPLAELKELKYAELQCNKIADASPLAEIPSIEAIYIGYNSGIKNVGELARCKNLKRLFLYRSAVSKYDIWKVCEGLPGCKVCNDYRVRWKKNFDIYLAFYRWKQVKEYETQDNIVYWDREVYK